jgi:hypothetical protein
MRVMLALPILLALGPALFVSVPAAAQTQTEVLMDPRMLMDPEDGSEPRRFVWRPSFELTNLGWDSNVFNLPEEPDRLPQDQLDKGDFITSFAAGLAPIWRPGAARIAPAGGFA